MVSSLFPLRLKDVTVRRKGRNILGPVTLDFATEGLTVVLGPNGSGKTTLLRTIHGVERLSSGTVTWGVDPSTAHRQQAYVFQQPIMLRRSVAENLRYPLLLSGATRRSTVRRVDDWLDRIGMAHLAQSQATRLSGGERQKLALARALISEPALLFLDEPCTNLDGRATKEIEALLIATRDSGTRILMATHDFGQARRLATDAVFLLSGTVHEYGPAARFFDRPETTALQSFFRGDIVE